MKRIRLIKDWNQAEKGTVFEVLQPGEDIFDAAGERRNAVDARRAAALIEQKLAVAVAKEPEPEEDDAGDGGDGGDSERDAAAEPMRRGRRTRRGKE